MSNPRTYAEAIKVAEPVTREVFDALVAECKGSVTVFEYRKMRRHASGFRLLRGQGQDCRIFEFDACSPRSGYTQWYHVYLSAWRPPVFDFYQVGRVVRVLRNAAEKVHDEETLAKVRASLERDL